MKKGILLASLLGVLTAAAAVAAGPDPRERNFKFFVDGAEIDGVVSRTDSRRLDLGYAPDQRQLLITVTQKGLNRLQDWLNGATDTATPTAKAVTIEARDNQDNLLARWELSGVMPSTFSSAAAGNISEIDSTIEFLFDRLRLVQANGK